MNAAVRIRLNAVIISVADERPRVMTVPDGRALPAGELEADTDATLELALRRLVEEQAGIQLGYVEQLYTFGDLARSSDGRTISIAYLALADAALGPAEGEPVWQDCYDLLPWEDWRSGRPDDLLDQDLAPTLEDWVGSSAGRRERAARQGGVKSLKPDGSETARNAVTASGTRCSRARGPTESCESRLEPIHDLSGGRRTACDSEISPDIPSSPPFQGRSDSSSAPTGYPTP